MTYVKNMEKSMKILTSVAMCTYNGERFIESQLCSILNQTVPVDEVIVCDDCSTDNTIKIVKRIARENHTPIHIYINKKNIGCTRNFEKAIRLCKGNIIFLSDQDDVWMPNKVDVFIKWFEKNPTMNVVFGDAFLIDEQGKLIKKSQIPYLLNSEDSSNEPMLLWIDSGFSKLSQKQFDRNYALELWLQMNRATGATMAFRKSFIECINFSVGDKEILHDCILSMHALVTNSLGYIIEPLIGYRQHANNVIGCDLKTPKPESWYDARFACQSWTDFSFLEWNKNQKYRIKFMSMRSILKKTFLGSKILCNTYSYISVYGGNWWYFYSYDLKEAILYTYKRIKKKLKYIMDSVLSH